MPALLDRMYGVGFIEARNTNPNGDPDAGNRPRVDEVSEIGLMTPMSIKRKIRNYIATVHNLPLYHEDGAILREKRADALSKAGRTSSKKNDKTTREDLRANQKVICAAYWDARTFGALMDLGESKAMTAKGPVWISMAESVDPVQVNEYAITRQSGETADEANAEKEKRTMGRLNTVSFGVYRFEFEVLPFYARDTDFSDADLTLFREALVGAFEQDQSATRKLGLRRLDVFRHKAQDNQPCLGHEGRLKLSDRVTVAKKSGVNTPARWADYDYSVDLEGLHTHIAHESWV
jgi:CRISPR-associated protein Csd2